MKPWAAAAIVVEADRVGPRRRQEHDVDGSAAVAAAIERAGLVDREVRDDRPRDAGLGKLVGESVLEPDGGGRGSRRSSRRPAISSAASRIVASTTLGVAPAARAAAEARWITPPSMIGSQCGIPTSIGVGARCGQRVQAGSAPTPAVSARDVGDEGLGAACRGPRAALAPRRPPPHPQRRPHRVEVLVPAPGQAHEHPRRRRAAADATASRAHGPARAAGRMPSVRASAGTPRARRRRWRSRRSRAPRPSGRRARGPRPGSRVRPRSSASRSPGPVHPGGGSRARRAARRAAQRERATVLTEVAPAPARLDADQLDPVGPHERREHPDRVRAAADAREHVGGVPAEALGVLRARLVADHPLEVPHELGNGWGPTTEPMM